MKISILIASIGVSLLIASRIQKKKDKAFNLFNEGVSLNLLSVEEQRKDNLEKAAALNKQSIEKFKKVVDLDPNHPVARSALAHSLYIDRNFSEAIYWFEEATKDNLNNASIYRERGLCKINIGQVPAGKADIDKAFSLDTTKEIRDNTVRDICDIADNALFIWGRVWQEGDSAKEKEYKKFSIGLLMMAFDYEQSKDIALKISDYASKFNDMETAEKYKKLAE